MASNLIRNFLNIFVKKSGDTMTGDLTVKLTGAASQDVGTFIVDTTAASQAALVAKNATNFAHFGNIAKFQMLNGTDSGAVVKIENAGTGNSLQIDSKFVVSSAGDLTLGGSQKIIGGTTTTSDLTLQTTSGVGTTGADMHFLVGNNGATEAVTVLNNGNVGIGTTTGINSKLTFAAATTAAGGILFGTDTNLYRSAADTLKTDDSLIVTGNTTTSGDVVLNTVGKGLQVKEGSNARMGVGTLVAGTVTINNTSVTANTRIFLTVQSLGTVAVATPIAVTARTAGTSFTVTSSDGTDTSTFAYLLVEPS